jgi:hypothetical protein
MRSLATFVFVLVCGALMCFNSPAFATVLFQDDFEGQAVGALLQSCTPPVGGGSYAAGIAANQLVIADAAMAPIPGVGNAGKFLCPNGPSSDGFAVLSAAAQTASTGQVVTYSMNMYVPSGSGTFGGIGSYGSASGWGLNIFDIYPFTDGVVKYYNNGDTTLQIAAGTFATDTWIPVQIVADFQHGTYAANVGGVTLSDVLNSSAVSGSRFYLSASTDGIAFDNLSITTVPEPSALLLMTAGLLGVLAYVWQKRK